MKNHDSLAQLLDAAFETMSQCLDHVVFVWLVSGATSSSRWEENRYEFYVIIAMLRPCSSSSYAKACDLNTRCFIKETMKDVVNTCGGFLDRL